ncbi:MULTISPECIES: TonB-dependent receptor [unclassified Cupriavidus]|uniref:TonB-dependent receptor n=1 Tax=Cupriavidus sp. H19C3 TaxID=3241603 RepID=UPI003BF904F9
MSRYSEVFRPNALVTAIAGPMAAMAMQGAAAQEAAPASRPAQLKSVTVQAQRDDYKVDTAQSPKFTAPLLDTPKSVTVVPAEVIQQSGSITLQDALRNTPGITFGAGEGGNPIADRPFIRGFDSMSSIFVDGVRDAASQTRDTFNIESIEVIKGPSSAYGGKGSVGGMINIVSKLPQKENFVQGSVGVGTDAYKRATLDGNYVLNDNTALRLNAMAYDANTPGREAVGGHSWGFAPSVTFGLTGPTKVTLSYYHLQGQDMPDYSIPYARPAAQATKANPVGPADVNRNNFYGLVDRDFRKTQSDIATAYVEHQFSDRLTFRNTTRWGRSTNDYIVTNPDDSRGNVPNGLVYRSTKNRDSATETLVNQTDFTAKFDTGFLKHTALFGFEFSRDDTNNTPYNVVPSVAGTTCNAALLASYNCTSLYNPNPGDPWTGRIGKMPATTNTTTNERSVYLFDTVEITKQWLVNGGVRYDSYRTHSFTPAYVNPNTNQNVAAVSLANNASFFNYQAGVVYKPLDYGSIYVSYGTASSPPGTTNGDGADNLSAQIQNLDPERSRAWELGTKWDLLDRRLSLTGAVFMIDKDNARVAVDANTTQNVGKQKVKGFELGFAGNVTDKWGVFGGYTYLHSELESAGPVNAANDGNQFPNTPKNTFSLWSTYQLLPALTVGGGAYYVDKVFGNPANSLYVPSYWRFDAMAAYRVNKNLTLQLNVQNLFNRTYYTKAFQAHYASLGAGRFGMLTANFRF